jgi:hypothetical protein
MLIQSESGPISINQFVLCRVRQALPTIHFTNSRTNIATIAPAHHHAWIFHKTYVGNPINIANIKSEPRNVASRD